VASPGEPERLVDDQPSAERATAHVAPGGPPARPASEPGAEKNASSAVFSVHLDVFEGPFDLLLGLISKHQLDVTSVALSQVTDEFLAHTRALGATWDLGQATDFLVVAATLLDLKAARLLPSAQVEDEEDLALLEARDLLFARLLQYRAYKLAAAHLGALLADESLRYPRQVSLEPRFAGLLPEVLLGLGPEQFARLAAQALAPKARPEVATDHVHGGTVSVREQTALLRERLRRTGGASFRTLTADCEGTLEVVARFLGLLELYREGVVGFDQLEALGDLHVRWTGGTASGPATSGGLTRGAETDEAPADQAMTDEAVTDQAMTDEAVTDQAMTDEAMTGQAMTHEAMAHEAMNGEDAGEPLDPSQPTTHTADPAPEDP
jgi:segregation and condensation protein A